MAGLPGGFGQERAEVPALLGPGAAARPGTGLVDRVEQAVPRPVRARAVRRRYGIGIRGGARMTRIERGSALMLTPAVVLFGLFVLVPSLIAVYVSLLHWDGIASPSWAGLDNWSHLFSDSLTLKSLWLTLQVVVLSWLVQTPISLLLGLFMAGPQRYRGVMS